MDLLTASGQQTYTSLDSLTEAVLMSTHHLGFWAEIRKKNVYPYKPQFDYIKVGFKGGGVKII